MKGKIAKMRNGLRKRQRNGRVLFIDKVFVILLFMLLTNFNNLLRIPNKDYFLLITIGIYCCMNLEFIFLNEKVNYVVLLVLIYSVWVVFVSFLNRNMTKRDPFLASIVYVGTLIEAIASMAIFYNKGLLKVVISMRVKWMTFFSVICIYQVIKYKIVLHDEKFDLYAVGGNFTTCYFLYEWICFYCVDKVLYKKNLSVFIKFVLCSLALFVSVNTKASTCIIAGVLFSVLLLCAGKNMFLFISRNVFFLSLFSLSLLFIFCYGGFTRMPVVQRLFEMLGEDLTMTGRTYVYDKITTLLNGHLMLGYGYGSQNEVISRVLPIYDAQNGFWNLVFSCGLIGALMYAGIFSIPYYLISQPKKKLLMPFYCYFTFIMVVAFVEIPYSSNLLLMSSIVIMCSLEIKKNGP